MWYLPKSYSKSMSIGMESAGLAYLGPIVGHLLAMLLMILPVLVDVAASEKLCSNTRSGHQDRLPTFSKNQRGGGTRIPYITWGGGGPGEMTLKSV